MTPSRGRSQRIRRVVAAVLCVVGLALIVFSGVQLYLTLHGTETPDVAQTSSQIPASVQISEEVDTTKPTADVLANYHVASDAPRALYIDKLGVRARIVSVGVSTDNSMQTPKNIYDSGWYTASARPGTVGAAVIDGHASGASRMGLFAYLDTLRTGDSITVERGDGMQFRYRVVHTETTPMDDVDMSKVLQPYGSASEGLNLITCTGTWVPAKRTYDHRVVVYTERI